MPRTMENNILKKSGYIWKDYMELIHENLEKQDFLDYRKEVIDIEKETTTTIEEETTTKIKEETSIEEATKDEPNSDIYVPETSEGDGIYIDNYN